MNHHTVYNTSKIFDGALMGVALLQYVYGLDVDNLVYEKLKCYNRDLFSTEKHQCLARLRISDTIILAVRSILVAWYDGAMTFLRLAKDMIEKGNEGNLESLKLENTISDLISTVTVGNLQQEANEYFERDIRLLPFITKRDRPLLQNVSDQMHLKDAIDTGIAKDESIRKICNGEFRSSVEFKNLTSSSRGLNCLLVHNEDPYLQVGPFEFEVNNRDPYRSVIHNFLTPNNIAKFDKVIRPKLTYEQAKPLVSREVVSNDLEDVYDVPMIFFGDRHPKHCSEGLAKIISHKIRIATHLQVSDDANPVRYRATMYGLGSMTEHHSDAFAYDVSSSPLYSKQQHTGNNLATVMLHFADATMGGGTYFSSRNYEGILPVRKRAALLWINLKASGDPEDNQRHGGCPLAGGSKLAVNKLFSHYPQWRKIPCGIDNNANINMNELLKSY